MKKLLFLILFAAIAVIAVHLYFSYKFEQQLEDMAGQVSMFGTLEWERSVLHPSGEARIEGLRFQPHMLGDGIRLDRLALTAPHYIALIRSTAELDDGRLPESLGISISGLRIRLDGDLAAMTEVAWQSGLPFETAGCAGRTSFSSRDLVSMGYRELRTSLSVNYRLIDGGDSMKLGISTATSDMAGLEAEADIHLGSASRDIALLQRAWAMARLENVEIHYDNRGFREAMMSFCAAELDQNIGEYRTHHLSSWLEAWARIGVQPGDELIAAYGEFLDQPDSVHLTTRPEPPLPLSSFNRLGRDELMQRLSPVVSVNGNRAHELQFEAVPSATLSSPDSGSSRPSQAGQTQTDAAAEDESETRSSPWQPVSFEQALQHAGSPVRITTADGQLIRGRLTASGGDLLHVRVQGVGGFFVRPYTRDQIAEIRMRH